MGNFKDEINMHQDPSVVNRKASGINYKNVFLGSL